MATTIEYGRFVLCDGIRQGQTEISDPPPLLMTKANGCFSQIETLLQREHQTHIPESMTTAEFFNIVVQVASEMAAKEILQENEQVIPLPPFNQTIFIIDPTHPDAVLHFRLPSLKIDYGGTLYLPTNPLVQQNPFKAGMPGHVTASTETPQAEIELFDRFVIDNPPGFNMSGLGLIKGVASKLKEDAPGFGYYEIETTFYPKTDQETSEIERVPVIPLPAERGAEVLHSQYLERSLSSGGVLVAALRCHPDGICAVQVNPDATIYSMEFRLPKNLSLRNINPDPFVIPVGPSKQKKHQCLGNCCEWRLSPKSTPRLNIKGNYCRKPFSAEIRFVPSVSF